MERSRRRLPSPALLIACLALFVALGGTVLAATKLDGRTIKVKSLPGNRLEPRSLPGNRLKAGTITGDRIDIDTLGQVPSADHADSADQARHSQTAVAADHAGDATTVNGHAVGCREGKRQFAGACWDVTANAIAMTPDEATETCVAEGGELPPALALLTFARQPGIDLATAGEWTNEVTSPGTGVYGAIELSPNEVFTARPSEEVRQFRCVTPLIQ
ncbi:MAG: hypothetical protein QM729_01990 [Solirubrobacterales bacterium]